MQFFSLLFVRSISLFIIFFTNKVLANNLLVSQYGIYKTIISCLSIISLISMPGANETLTYIISNTKKGAFNLIRKREKNIYIISLILLIIYFSINFGIININFKIYNLWLLGIILLPNYLSPEIITSGFIALKRFKVYNFFQISQYGLTLIAVLIATKLGIDNGANIIILTMLICALPYYFFKNNLKVNISNGYMDKDTKSFFKKQNLSKAPQLLFNTDLIIFMLRSGTVASGEIAAFNIIPLGLKTFYGVAQNRLTNFLYITNLKQLQEIIYNKYTKILYLLFIIISFFISLVILPEFFKFIFNEDFYHIIPMIKIYSSIYLITLPISLLNIPLKINLDLKGNLFINSIHPFISLLLTLFLSNYGVIGYLISKIILILIINFYYIISLKKLFNLNNLQKE